MKSLFYYFVLLFAFYHQTGSAQLNTSQVRFEDRTKSSIFVELLGNGGIYSVNYDRIVFQKNNLFLAARLGGFYLPQRDNNFYAGCPIELNLLAGKKRLYFECGVGLSYLYNDNYYWLTDGKGTIFEIVDERIHDLSLSFRAGLRFQNPNGGFFFRAGFTPKISIYHKSIDKYNGVYTNRGESLVFIPWGGISLGFTLKKLNPELSKLRLNSNN